MHQPFAYCAHISQNRNSNKLKLDLSVRAGGLNTGRVYTGSDKIRVGCISGLGKIWIGCILALQVSDQSNGFKINPTGLERLFQGYFFFYQNKKLDIFIS